MDIQFKQHVHVFTKLFLEVGMIRGFTAGMIKPFNNYYLVFENNEK